MASDKADMIRLLEAELDFIEGGGYGKPAGQPNVERPIFHHSPACINSWTVPGHDTECHNDCVLLDAVPHANREETLPCHFIPLNDAGDTLETLEGKVDQEQLEETVKQYLRNEIKRLKEDDDAPGQPGLKY